MVDLTVKSEDDSTTHVWVDLGIRFFSVYLYLYAVKFERYDTLYRNKKTHPTPLKMITLIQPCRVESVSVSNNSVRFLVQKVDA